jgi:hypothetical protein
VEADGHTQEGPDLWQQDRVPGLEGVDVLFVGLMDSNEARDTHKI